MSAQIVLLPVFVLVGLTLAFLLVGARAGDETKSRDVALSRSALSLLFYTLIALALPLRHADLVIVLLSWVFVSALLFLIGWDRSGRWLRHRHGLRFRRGYRAPKLRPHAVASPQLSALDPTDEFAAHRFFRPDLHLRLVAGLWRCILGVCTCRKTNCGKNNKGLHCHFPFAFGAGTTTWPSLKTTLSTEAKSGSARRASATVNEGSGFHFAPLLTSDSAASVIA